MSKLSFGVAIPHQKPEGGGSRTFQFYISCASMTYLNVKGKDIMSARLGNSNASRGWKSRFEFSCISSKPLTKLAVVMNTSAILPPAMWTFPGPPSAAMKADAKKDKKGDRKGKDKEDKGKEEKRKEMKELPAGENGKILQQTPHNSSSSRSSSSSSRTRVEERMDRRRSERGKERRRPMHESESEAEEIESPRTKAGMRERNAHEDDSHGSRRSEREEYDGYRDKDKRRYDRQEERRPVKTYREGRRRAEQNEMKRRFKEELRRRERVAAPLSPGGFGDFLD